jgi:hypothetical protein
MKIPKYALRADQSFTVFEFVSLGANGEITKRIEFTKLAWAEEVYNLGFGDLRQPDGEMDDLAVSNNGDSQQVLATVVGAVYEFTARHPHAWVYAEGSTPARLRLYRMAIAKHLIEVTKDFRLFGLKDESWEEFAKTSPYRALLAQRK